MRARLWPKWIPFFLLSLSVLSAPGGAVAHGVAHRRQADQRTEHERLESASRLLHGSRDAVIESSDHHGDHDDVRSDDGIPLRREAAVPTPSLVAELPVVRFDAGRSEAAFVHAARPRADPDTGPPPQLRAPPTV